MFNSIIFICAYNYVEDPQMIQLLLYTDIAVGNSYEPKHDKNQQNDIWT